MRGPFIAGFGVSLCMWAAAASAEVVFDRAAPAETPVSQESAHPAIPSIVFANPEARDSGLMWMPSNAPFIARPPLLLKVQPQSAPAPVNQPSVYANVFAHPPNTVVANANLNAAHAYRFNSGDPAPCSQTFSWNLAIGLPGFLPRFNCGFFSPYVPLVASPPGLNRPTDRPSNAANAARALGQAHNYKFQK